MSDRHHQEKHTSHSARLVRIIQRYRLVFIIVVGAALIFPIAFYVIDTVTQKNLAAGAKTMYDLDQKNEAYNTAADKDKKAAAEKELFSAIDQASAQFGGSYAGAYALLMRSVDNYTKIGDAATTDKKTPALAIIQDLSNIVDRAGDNILVTVAYKQLAIVIQNLATLVPAASGGGSAVTLDEVLKLVPRSVIGDAKPAKTDDVAYAVYKSLVDRFPKSLYSAEALINMGFMLEAKGDAKAAYDLYGKLESGYGNNLWTKMAVNRKIALESEGLATK